MFPISKRFVPLKCQGIAARFPIVLLLATLAMGMGINATAAVPGTGYEQAAQIHAPNAVASIGVDLFGDTVNLYTGRLSFVQTDVSLKGNNALEVAASRRFVPATSVYDKKGRFGRWELELPQMHGIFNMAKSYGTPTIFSCAQFSDPAHVKAAGTFANSVDFWLGNHLYIPGHGDQELLSRDPSNSAAPGPVADYPLVTSASWNVSCLKSLANGAPEGFLATSPTGVKYRFDRVTTYDQYQIRVEAGIHVRYSTFHEVQILGVLKDQVQHLLL
ncbi:hypothetical protein [Massilia sp. TWP1-3-3]|uniref:hypothetical protein n=1 Tax=Massilia sp. TWP1-3-3 TaxID=2804573 RepID=UPI003CEFCF92